MKYKNSVPCSNYREVFESAIRFLYKHKSLTLIPMKRQKGLYLLKAFTLNTEFKTVQMQIYVLQRPKNRFQRKVKARNK